MGFAPILSRYRSAGRSAILLERPFCMGKVQLAPRSITQLRMLPLYTSTEHLPQPLNDSTWFHLGVLQVSKQQLVADMLAEALQPGKVKFHKV